MEYVVKKSDRNIEIINLSPDIFEKNYNEILVHQLVTYYLNKIKPLTKAQKSRGNVSGGGIKPWKQKGSGRARVGSIRSPLWRGGGKIFAINPGTIKGISLNKKMYKSGIKVILSNLLRLNRMIIVENIDLKFISTKNFLSKINYLNIINNSLFIVNDFNIIIHYSSRNLINIKVISWKKINPLNLLKYKNIFITIDAIQSIEKAYK